MAVYQTQYQSLPSFDEDTDDNDVPTQDADVMIHVVPESTRWNHIENLDDFFTRVYHFHQRGGFLCMVISDVLQLVQFLFVVIFSTFLIECVNYDVLFANIKMDMPHKVTIPEALVEDCISKFDFRIVICLLVAMVFWLFRLIKVSYNIFKYTEIRSFYLYALKISSCDLPNMTWHEVQRRLLEVQREQQMCIHKQELTELDIYHRILRFKNYQIAMEKKSILPVKYSVPVIGSWAFLSTGLKYNLEIILFWGPWSPFENNWKLKEDYKQSHKRKQLAEYLSQKILWIGIANFALSPLIFLWQILYSFFRYADLIKRQPGVLGTRRWSNYARLYLRHYNELDHEFSARLNRGYRAANKYMEIFTSPLLTILAKNIAFFAGSLLAVLVVLTVIDEDVLAVEHVLTTMTLSGLVVTGCKVLIPDEHMVYCPEILMRNILAHVHYMPTDWTGNAHTTKVRDEFSNLFHYKMMYLVEELLSPIITPVILCFSLRHKSLEIVDFFRSFTVDVVGVGDVCAFAQLDVRKKTGIEKQSQQTECKTDIDPRRVSQADEGKVEMSLMHFHLTNPEWKPPKECSFFINDVKEQAQKDLTSLSLLQQPEAAGLFTSSQGSLPSLMLPSNTYGQGLGYNSLASSVALQSGLYPQSTHMSLTPTGGVHHRLRGGISGAEGPLGGTSVGILGSMQTSGSLQGSTLGAHSSSGVRQVDEGTLELMSHDMSFSALYLHDLQQRRVRGLGLGHQNENLEDMRARAMWNRQDSNQATNTTATGNTMPHIQEGDEIDREEIKDGTKSV